MSLVNLDLETKISTQQEWRDELLRTGIRGKGNQSIEFSRIQAHPTSKWIHAVAETKEEKPNILIDDYIKNIREWEAKGGIGILHTDVGKTISELKRLGFK